MSVKGRRRYPLDGTVLYRFRSPSRISSRAGRLHGVDSYGRVGRGPLAHERAPALDSLVSCEAAAGDCGRGGFRLSDRLQLFEGKNGVAGTIENT